MVDFNKESRLEEYRTLLTKEGGPTAEDLLTLNDLINQDLTTAEEYAAQATRITAENSELRDTNHKLFLRVTGGEQQEQDSREVTSRDDAAKLFAEMIEKGEL